MSIQKSQNDSKLLAQKSLVEVVVEVVVVVMVVVVVVQKNGPSAWRLLGEEIVTSIKIGCI